MLVANFDEGGAMRRATTIAGLALAGLATTTAHASSDVSSARRAVSTAHEAVRHGRPYDLERDRHRGAAVWEVKVATRSGRPYELLVSDNGRKIVDRRRDDDRSDDARRARHAKVGLRRALGIASRHSSAPLSDAEIDRHRGRIVWTASFERGRTETEVIVDARTGRVLDVRHETDEDD
jgi:uncharacterized membrane protein YkoI